ncbi:MAG: hypothetical protein CVV42_05535 [Candidatus Riflebacteria bacterium HGW-Riflebacteria-2]|jgi:hypothetical protein|nr:MAG: hypothetical protein CVV42_05535 [Candidatus Riflebacteria bacterium HGW-Riflebacteria-2]
MSKNRSGLFKAALALSLMLFVIAFVIVKSGAIETRVEKKTVDGVETEVRSHHFNSGKIPIYLKSVTAPLTGKKALEQD